MTVIYRVYDSPVVIPLQKIVDTTGICGSVTTTATLPNTVAFNYTEGQGIVIYSDSQDQVGFYTI